MTRVQLVLVAVLAFVTCTSAIGLHHQAEFDAEKQSEPPHHARLAGAPPGPTLPPAAWGADPEGVQRAVTDLETWVTGALEEQRAREQEREAAAAMADLARRNPVRSSDGDAVPGDCAALAEQFGVSISALERESHCTADPNLLNAGGCGGRGCVGPAQLDLGHFATVSPWNPGVSGVCADLDPGSLEGQAECARRLPASAWR